MTPQKKVIASIFNYSKSIFELIVSDNDIKCQRGLKEETELVTEETPTEFSTAFMRSWLTRRRLQWQTDQGESSLMS